MAERAAGAGRATVVAGAVIGIALLSAALLLRDSVDRAAGEMAALRKTLEVAIETAPSRGGEEERPDPRRRYSVDLEGAPIRGDAAAKLAIVEFSDFECPFCNRVNPTLLTLLEEYDGKVKLAWKHLPLTRIHQRARDAHIASAAAHRQGKFWEMHDKIFADQRRMAPERYREYAQELGLDLERFDRDLADPAVARDVDRDLADAAQLGVTGTPTFLVNGRLVSGALPIDTFRALIDGELGAS
jgi:protein-disulfide isomerase